MWLGWTMSTVGTVRALSVAPVKGMAVHLVPEVEIGPAGVIDDRRFLVVERDGGALAETTRTPALLAIAARWSAAERELELRLPDGRVVREEVRPGAPAATHGYDGRTISGRLVDGELAAAVGEHLGRPVRLLERDAGQMGADDHPVTLVAAATVEALAAAPALDGQAAGERRFRMTLTVDGPDAWAEHGWGACELAIGTARLVGVAPVPRCVVTTRDPDTGARDLPVLRALAQLRGKRDVHLGLWCGVVAGGRVAVGDAVRLGAPVTSTQSAGGTGDRRAQPAGGTGDRQAPTG